MRLLAIESSCDDSSVALLDVEEGRIRDVRQLIANQEIHAKYGGVVPEVAAREHSASVPVLLRALADEVTGTSDGVKLGTTVDAVAVTGGPGLATSLRVGVETARGLALAWNVPLYAMNHIEGHVYSNWLPNGGAPSPLEGAEDVFPALVLVVSGGHTELLHMKGHGDYVLLGATRDDAAGEAFDKTAKLLGLGYPGGPAISRLAEKGDAGAVKLPRPMIAEAHLDMSFSGLKTAVRYFIRDNEAKLADAAFVADVAASVQEAIVDVLVAKTCRAAEAIDAKTVLLAGGVAANGRLRAALRLALADRMPETRFVEPPMAYTTDNAAMVGMAAVHRIGRDDATDDPARLDARPDWELGRP